MISCSSSGAVPLTKKWGGLEKLGTEKPMKLLSLKYLSFQILWVAEIGGAEAPISPQWRRACLLISQLMKARNMGTCTMAAKSKRDFRIF